MFSTQGQGAGSIATEGNPPRVRLDLEINLRSKVP